MVTVRRSLSRLDPTRTVTLRKAFLRELKQRLLEFRRNVSVGVLAGNLLGLATNAEEFRFLSIVEKAEAFKKWVQGQFLSAVLGLSGAAGWWRNYTTDGYSKGLGRAYAAVKPIPQDELPLFQRPGQEDFVRISMQSRRGLDALDALDAKSRLDLGKLGEDVATNAVRMMLAFPDKSASFLESGLDEMFDDVFDTKSKAIVNTNIVSAHAEGQLDGYELLGVDEVEAEVEWVTAGDNKVCSRCSAMSGKVYKVEESHGLIPLHPNCRCMWRPV